MCSFDDSMAYFCVECLANYREPDDDIDEPVDACLCRGCAEHHRAAGHTVYPFPPMVWKQLKMEGQNPDELGWTCDRQAPWEGSVIDRLPSPTVRQQEVHYENRLWEYLLSVQGRLWRVDSGPSEGHRWYSFTAYEERPDGRYNVHRLRRPAVRYRDGGSTYFETHSFYSFKLPRSGIADWQVRLPDDSLAPVEEVSQEGEAPSETSEQIRVSEPKTT